MNSPDSLENDLQSIFFYGLPSSYDIEEWRKILDNFGHMRVFYISPSRVSGYALFENYQYAAAAAQELDQKCWPEGSSNQISVQVISNEEIDSVIRLGVQELQDVSVIRPESAGSLFNVTKTEPPIYWSFSKNSQ